MTVTRTMFEIEREARWRVWALFALLLLMVYLCIWVVVMAAEIVVEAFSPTAAAQRHFLAFSLSLRGASLILLSSAAVAVLYWFVSRIGARDHLTRAMPPTVSTSVSPTSSKRCDSRPADLPSVV